MSMFTREWLLEMIAEGCPDIEEAKRDDFANFILNSDKMLIRRLANGYDDLRGKYASIDIDPFTSDTQTLIDTMRNAGFDVDDIVLITTARNCGRWGDWVQQQAWDLVAACFDRQPPQREELPESTSDNPVQAPHED